MKKTDTQRLRILVADPDQELGAIIGNRLSNHGFFIEVVGNADEAIEHLKKNPYQVILADQCLTDSHGKRLYDHVWESPLPGDPELVLMSNSRDFGLPEAHEAGACYLIKKPFNYDELLSVVSHFKPTEHDQRRYERASVNPAVLGNLYGEIRQPRRNSRGPYQTMISEIGRGGFFFQESSQSALPAVGQVIEFEIKLGMVPDFHIKGTGIIRWVRKDGTGAGVEFLEINAEAENFVKAFVELFKIRPFVPPNS